MTELFYKRLESGKVEFLDDRIKVYFMPFSFEYCGTYFVHSAVPDGIGNPMFRTMKNPTNETPDFEMMELGFGEYFITISDDKRKVIIFDKARNGVILKR